MDKLRETLFSRKWWVAWAYVVIGCFVLAAGFVLFINPYNIVPGGVYGAGIVMHYLFPAVQVGTFGFMFDIPLLIIGIAVFGRMFGARTIVASVLTPAFMNLLTYLIGNDPATMLDGRIDLTGDTLLACIFGGVLVGGGVGLVIRTRATTGGTDIVAMLLNKYAGLTFSRAIFIVDSLVVVFGMVVLGDWRLPLYSLITIFVSSQVINFVIDGASYDKLLFILSDRHDELRDFIISGMDRGGTIIKSSGMYTRQDKQMIFLVVSRREVAAVEKKIKELDPSAFVVVVDAHETIGEGFRPFSDK